MNAEHTVCAWKPSLTLPPRAQLKLSTAAARTYVCVQMAVCVAIFEKHHHTNFSRENDKRKNYNFLLFCFSKWKSKKIRLKTSSSRRLFELSWVAFYIFRKKKKETLCKRDSSWKNMKWKRKKQNSCLGRAHCVFTSSFESLCWMSWRAEAKGTAK